MARFSVLFLLVFQIQNHSLAKPPAEACGQKLCPEFITYFTNEISIKRAHPTVNGERSAYMFGFIDAVMWCAHDQCDPNLSQNGEHGCYFGNMANSSSGGLTGSKHATNWSYLVRPPHSNRAMGENKIDNCNEMWRNLDKREFYQRDNRLVLSFQHPCDREVVGCEVTLFKDGSRPEIREKNVGRKPREKRELGMQNVSAGFYPGKYGSRTQQPIVPINNNPSVTNRSSTTVTTTTPPSSNLNPVPGNLTNLGNGLNGEPTTTAAVPPADSSEVNFPTALRLPSNDFQKRNFTLPPIVDLVQKIKCENKELDPGPTKDGVKIYVGKNYKYELNEKKNGYVCIGQNNLSNSKIVPLCSGQQRMSTFIELKLPDGRTGCEGFVDGVNVVILD